jgi:hypothetical protein
MMNEARFARRPALLRFSAAHEAHLTQRARPAGPTRDHAHPRAFAVTVAVFVSKSPVFVTRTTQVA